MIISVEHAAASLNADVYHADERIYAAHVGVRKGFQELDRRNVYGRRRVDARFEGANVDGPEDNDFRKRKNSS